MRNAKRILKGLLYPPKGVLVLLPPLSFAALAYLFAFGNTESVPAYGIYGLSAYSLTVWIAALPGFIKRVRAAIRNSRLMQWFSRSEFGGRYLHDPAFRGSVGIYRGMIVDFGYVLFRMIVSVCYASVWFFSMAVYYLVLGGLRVYLIVCYRRRGTVPEWRGYRRTAWLLFLLNIPMGGMILLMVRTNSGYSYPGYIIYLSALYAFYTVTVALVNLVKFRKLGSPVLSAAKVLNFVAAMMSILGLQTAMIAHFSENGESYRRMMNGITGSCVYGIVIGIALYMLHHSRTFEKEAEAVE